MLPKFLTHYTTATPSTSLSTTRRLYCTLPLVLLGLLLVLHPVISNAERDFNFNDSQVPLLEPKDEPTLIDTQSSTTSTHQYLQQHQQDPYAVELSNCRFGDHEIVLSLVLKNYNWHDLSDNRKDKVLEKLSKFFAIPKEFITMESVTKHELFEMQKESLKRGNNKCHNNNNRKLGRVNFIIGCGSTYFTMSEPISKQIAQQFKDGALDNITGEKFGWWVIWRKQIKTRSQRNRRQIEGSGEDDEDDEDYYDYDDDNVDESAKDISTTTTHAHRHHHGDSTSEITSNMLEVTNTETDNNSNNNNNLKKSGVNDINKNDDDIIALKQTDNDNDSDNNNNNNNNNVNEDIPKKDSNLLLLNKKGAIDEEIVESVSQLESVITKTIENTKNLDDLPEIVVDQPDDEILSEVLQQPLIPSTMVEDVDLAKNSENINLNTIYENPNEVISNNEDNIVSNLNINNNDDFKVAEVLDSLTPSTTTMTSSSSSGSLSSSNSAATNSPLSAVVNLQENFDSLSASTTPLSFNSNINNNNNKDNHHLDLLSPSSSHDQHHHHHHVQHHSSPTISDHHPITSSTLLNDSTTITTTTTVITTNSHLTPAIITDSTTSSSTLTNTPIDSSSITSSATSSSSSSSSSTISSNILNKYELTTYSPNEMSHHNKNNNEDDDEEQDGGVDMKINEEMILNTLTTIMTPPATTMGQHIVEKQHQQQYYDHHQQHYDNDSDDDDDDENIEMAKTKATTTLLTTSSSSSSSSPSLTSSPSLYGSIASSSSSSSNIDMLATTIITPFDVLTTTTTTPTTITPITTTTTSTNIQLELEVPIETIFENVNGKKDMTTIEPEDNQDSTSKSSTATPQSSDDSIYSSPTTTVSSTSSQATTTPSIVPEIVSSTPIVPDYIEPKIENSPPMIKSRLQKLAVTSGKSFKLTVPDDTFYDNEDLSNLRLELTDKEGRELKTNSWLQFNAETKEIYGLPLDDAVSKWQYRLTATDSGNDSVTEILEIAVQQHRGVRTVNHEINIAVKINEKNTHYIDWQMNLINAIAATLGDDNTNSVVVREIRSNPQDPSTATLVYFNETLPTNECPENELNSLVKRLDANRLSDLVQPTLGIKSITGQLIGSCLKAIPAKPKTPTINIKNSNPIARNQVDRVVATVGHLLVYKVPTDTFFDPNGDELTLSLKTKEHKELSARHWLQFDSKNEEFYGIPKSGDFGPEEYLLVAEDAGGLTGTDALVVQVNHAPKKEFSAYFKAYLAIRHELFNADLQRKFVERIAQLFGDATTQNIQIRSLTTHHDSDGTIVNFYNNTLFKSHNRCPEEEMEILRSVYLHDYTLRERVKKIMGPELNITNMQVIPLGSCNAQTDVTHREFVPNKTEEPLLKSTFSEDYMYTIILPAIIIVSMILIASIIACCLHRRRRKSGKMELGDEEERKSFRTKGIPVIFQDELDEKPEIGNKSPIILKDEKPPLLPPSYNTSNMNGDNDVDEYVPPPAVVVGGREARGKSPATPSYRKPPPYVSP